MVITVLLDNVFIKFTQFFDSCFLYRTLCFGDSTPRNYLFPFRTES